MVVIQILFSYDKSGFAVGYKLSSWFTIHKAKIVNSPKVLDIFARGVEDQ